MDYGRYIAFNDNDYIIDTLTGDVLNKRGENNEFTHMTLERSEIEVFKKLLECAPNPIDEKTIDKYSNIKTIMKHLYAVSGGNVIEDNRKWSLDIGPNKIKPFMGSKFQILKANANKRYQPAKRIIEAEFNDEKEIEIQVLQQYKIDALNKRFAIVKGLPINKDTINVPVKQGREQVNIVEVVEEENDQGEIIYHFKQFLSSTDRVWIREMLLAQVLDTAKYKEACEDNIDYLKVVSDQLFETEAVFFEHPEIRPYFFEKADELPEDNDLRQVAINVANRYGVFIQMTDKLLLNLPTDYAYKLLAYERKILLSKTVQLAMIQCKDRWMIFRSYIDVMDRIMEN